MGMGMMGMGMMEREAPTWRYSKLLSLSIVWSSFGKWCLTTRWES